MHPDFSFSNEIQRAQARQQRHVDIQRLWRRLAVTPRALVGNPVNSVAPPQCGELQTRAAGAGSDDGSGDDSWVNPNHIVGLEASAASYLLPSGGGMTSRLVSSAHGFTIPGAATIGGIYVRVWRRRDVLSIVTDESLWLTKNGIDGVGVPRWSGEIWPTADAVAVYGSAGDLWEATWTAEEINAATFGVMLRANSPGGSSFVTLYVDMIEVAVCYTL